MGSLSNEASVCVLLSAHATDSQGLPGASLALESLSMGQGFISEGRTCPTCRQFSV